MTMVPTSWIPLLAVAGFVIGTVAWLIHVNRAMMCVPERAVAMSPRRWTREQIQAAYERVKKQPADFSRHLPPRLDRRYVVVGGSGEFVDYQVLYRLDLSVFVEQFVP